VCSSSLSIFDSTNSRILHERKNLAIGTALFVFLFGFDILWVVVFVKLKFIIILKLSHFYLHICGSCFNIYL